MKDKTKYEIKMVNGDVFYIEQGMDVDTLTKQIAYGSNDGFITCLCGTGVRLKYIVSVKECK